MMLEGKNVIPHVGQGGILINKFVLPKINNKLMNGYPFRTYAQSMNLRTVFAQNRYVWNAHESSGAITQR